MTMSNIEALGSEFQDVMTNVKFFKKIGQM